MIQRRSRRHVKSYLQNSRLKKRRRNRRNLRIALVIFILAALATGFVYFCRMNIFQLKDISVQGMNKLEDSEIKHFIEVEIAKNKNVFGLIQPTSSFFISDQGIENSLIGQFPRIESVIVHNTFTGHMSVTLVERQGKARWCSSVPGDGNTRTNQDAVDEAAARPKTDAVTASSTGITDTDESTASSSKPAVVSIAPAINKNNAEETCYEFDKTGYIFDRIIFDRGTDFSNEGQDILAMDATQASKFQGLIEGNPIGQRFLDEVRFNKLVRVIQFANSIDLKDDSVSCQTIDLCTIHTANNGRIHIDISGDMDILIERLDAVFKSKALKNVQFYYVDARYGNKVFYKTDATIQADN